MNFEREIKNNDDFQGPMRRAARHIAVASARSDSARAHGVGIEVSKLTFGLDPDGVNRQSPAYKFGVRDALSAVVNALSEQTVSSSTEKLLSRNYPNRVFNMIANHPGLSICELMEMVGDDRLGKVKVNLAVANLNNANLIEPAIGENPKKRNWQLSEKGIEIFADREKEEVRRELYAKIAVNDRRHTIQG